MLLALHNLSSRFITSFKPKAIVPYGVKRGKQYQIGRIMTRVSAVKGRRLEEERGILLDTKKQFRMEIKRNSGIGWARSLQVCKHLEMHVRGPGPAIDQQMREKITQIVNLVRREKVAFLSCLDPVNILAVLVQH